VRGVVSAAGGLTATTAYDAWGNPETAGGLTSYTPFGYAGGYTDPTGLIYPLARYYDPSTGQFLSVDPKVGQTQTPYSYADGNPVSNTDPNGCITCLGTYKNEVSKLYFWRTRSGTLGWDFYLTVLAIIDLGPVVKTQIDGAFINGQPINPPYRAHIEFATYDFHSSLNRYQFIGKAGGGSLRTNDYLQVLWEVDSMVYEGEYALRDIECTIPRAGSGRPGPYGPDN